MGFSNQQCISNFAIQVLQRQQRTLHFRASKRFFYKQQNHAPRKNQRITAQSFHEIFDFRVAFLKNRVYICPDIYAMGCPDKNGTEIILNEPDPVSTGVGSAKGNFSCLIG